MILPHDKYIGVNRLDIARLPVGTTSTTVAAGNDARFTDARTPTSHKTSHATGGTDALTPSDIGAASLSHAHSATNDLTFSGATAGQVLTVNSGATALVWSTPATYSLPTASASTLGGVKVGSGLSIDGSGVLSATYSYTLPAATTSTLGGVIVGSGLSVTSGTVSANVTSVAGRTGAVVIAAADVSGLASVATAGTFASLTSKPTTLSGYGITDGVTTSDSRLSDNRTPTDGSVTTAKLANAAVTVAKVSATGTASGSTFLRGDGTWAAAGSTNASDLTTGTLANARLTTRARASVNLYLWSSFR